MDEHVPTPTVRPVPTDPESFKQAHYRMRFEDHERLYTLYLLCGMDAKADEHYAARNALAGLIERLADVEGSPHP